MVVIALQCLASLGRNRSVEGLAVLQESRLMIMGGALALAALGAR